MREPDCGCTAPVLFASEHIAASELLTRREREKRRVGCANGRAVRRMGSLHVGSLGRFEGQLRARLQSFSKLREQRMRHHKIYYQDHTAIANLKSKSEARVNDDMMDQQKTQIILALFYRLFIFTVIAIFWLAGIVAKICISLRRINQ